MKRIILASKSTRRIQLLKEAGFDVIVIPSNAKEIVKPGITPAETVKELSRAKAESVRKILSTGIDDINNNYENQYAISNSTPILSEDLPIVAADTIVYRNSIIGKPKDKEDAYNILMDLSGKSHEVYTGVTIQSILDSEYNIQFVDKTTVFFKEYNPEDISDYLNTEEPYDKAGAYAIQGYFGRFIDHIDGDYNNVMGLPVYRLIEYL